MAFGFGEACGVVPCGWWACCVAQARFPAEASGGHKAFLAGRSSLAEGDAEFGAQASSPCAQNAVPLGTCASSDRGWLFVSLGSLGKKPAWL